LQEKLLKVPEANRALIAAALESCTVIQESDAYQVCRSGNGKFRFVMVKDFTGKWRVLLW